MTLLLDPALARLWFAASRLDRTLASVAVAPATGRGPDEQHTVPTLVVGLEGVVRVGLARAPVDLHPGEALLLPPGARHEHIPLRAGSAALGMGFMLGRADVEVATAAGTWILTIAEQPARRLVEEACRAPAPDRLRLVREALGALAVEPARPLAPMPDPVRRMWLYLRRERLSPIGAGDVLRASGLGPTRANALFRSWFGETPLRMLRRHRLDYARHLIADGTPVAAAAAACGFRSRRHLTAACRTVHGRPPSRLG